jgi:hypothetical protein
MLGRREIAREQWSWEGSLKDFSRFERVIARYASRKFVDSFVIVHHRYQEIQIYGNPL